MRLWLLEQANWPGPEEAGGFVVRAATEAAARALAASQCGDEGAQTWIEATRSTCYPITTKDEPGIVMRSYNAG